MEIFTKIGNSIIYAGLNAEDYNSIEKKFKQTNGKILMWMSVTIAVLFLGLWAIGMGVGNNLPHIWVLLMTACVSALFAVVTKIVGAGNYKIIQAMTYLFSIFMYAVGILIDGVFFAESTAACMAALVVILPLAFSDRPIITGGLSFVAIILFVTNTYFVKPLDAWLDDVMRLTAVGGVSFVLNVLLNKFKTTSMFFEYRNNKIQAMLEQKSREFMAVHTALKSGDWSVFLDEDGDVNGYEWSNEACRLLGYRDFESVKGSFGQWVEKIHPDDRDRLFDAFRQTVADTKNDRNFDAEFRIKNASGRYLWFRIVGRAIRNSVGKATTMWGLLIDINSKKSGEASVLRQLAMVEALSKEYKDVFIVNIEADRIITVKKDGEMITDFGAHVRQYKGTWEYYAGKYIHPEDVERVLATFESENAMRVLKKNGELVCTYRVIQNDVLHHFQAVYLYIAGTEAYDPFIVSGYRNIDSIVEAEEELKRNLNAAISEANETKEALSLVEIDDLTGVYTRQAFLRHAREIIDSNPDNSYDLTITDFEDFKIVNDQFGTKMADELLCWFGKYLGEKLGEEALIGRYSGDQFAVLTNNKDTEKIGQIVLDDICGRRKPESLPEVVVKIGVYFEVNRDTDVSVMCDRAHMALSSVKHHYGMHWAKYDEDIKRQMEKQRHIELSMHQAVTDNQFKVYYQPKHDAKTGKLIGAEALLRWVHPEYGFMSPAEFIPLFEKNGFITEADTYVWNSVCNDIKTWEQNGMSPVPVSVNVSRMDFLHGDFFSNLDRVVDNTEIDKKLLHIEITETLIMDEIDTFADTLSEFKEKGYSIELDDFGAGYSSLGVLNALPIDVVKLDMSFMRQFKDAKKAKILASCIELSKNLGLKTISEGVETKEQLDVLNDMGIDSIQGYYYSKPLPQDEFIQYMEKCTEH